MLSTDTRDNNEYKKEKDPGYILIPAESQEKIRSFLMRVKFSPVKHPESTEGNLAIEAIRDCWNIEDQCTDEEGYGRDNHNTNATKICEIEFMTAETRGTAHVQLMLAILARAWPPRMLFRMVNPTPPATESRLGIMTP